MSGYIVNDGETIEYIIDGVASNQYWRLYSDIQRNRNKKVLNQMLGYWYEVQKTLMFMRAYNIDVNDFMMRISKVYFLTARNSTDHTNDLKQRKKAVNDRKRRLIKIRSLKMLI